MNSQISKFMHALVLAAFFAAEISFAQTSVPQVFNLTGRLVRPDGTAVQSGSVEFQLQIRSPGTENCILFEETHTLNMTNADGLFSIKLGTGLRAGTNYKDTSTLAQVFLNSGTTISTLNCASGTTYAAAASDSRKLRISFDEGSGVQTLAQDQTIQSVPYAMYADRLQGKAVTDFVQTITSLESTPGTTQTRVNQIIDTDWAGLNALLAGTSTLYAKAVPTGAVDYNNQRIVNVANPTSPQDAATKDYSDTKIGGNAAVVGVLAPGDAGKTLTWDGTKWVAQTPSTMDVTKLPLAGGTMTGAINMGAQNITNAGHIQLGLQKTLLLGRYDNTQETALVSTLLAADNGRVWFNTDASKQRLWNGTAAVDVGSSTLVVGTTAGTAMGADAVPNCTGAQKLQMSLGPTYSWTCVTDTATQWTTSGSTIYYSGGNVGIGTATPASALDVVGRVNIRHTSNAYTPVLYIDNSVAPATGYGPQILFRGGATVSMGNVGAQWEGATGNNASLVFETSTASVPSEKMRITSGGNVGIGTTSPADKLEVRGSGYVGTRIVSSTAGAYNEAGLQVDRADQTNGYAQLHFATGGTDSWSVGLRANDSNLHFFTTQDKIVLTTAGQVGIGTTSPATLLDVAGTIRGTGVQASGGSAALPAYTFSGDTSSGIYQPAASALGLSSGGAERIRVNSSGYVGIGTTSPVFTLDVNGSIRTAGGLFFNSAATDYINTGGTNIIKLATNGSERLRVDASGNVGIGTTSPTAALTLRAGSATAGTAPLKLIAGTNLTAPEPGAIEFDGTNLYYTNAANARQTIATGVSSGGDFKADGSVPMSGNLRLNGRYLSGDGDNEGIHVNAAGKVGIGTTTPTFALEVNPGATDGIIAGRAYVGGWSGGTTEAAFSHSDFATFTSYAAVRQDNVGRTYLNSANNSPIQFGHEAIEYMRMTPAGKFGIGTTTPTAMLQLKAGTAAAGTAPLKLTAGTNLTTPEAGAIEFDGTNLYYTNASNARQTIATGAGGTGDFKADGSVNMTGAIKLPNGTASAPALAFASDTNLGVYRVNSNILGFATSGAERLRINSSGLTVTGGMTTTSTISVGTTTSVASLTVDGAIALKTTTKPTYNSQHGMLYTKSDSRLYYLDSGDAEYPVPIGVNGSQTSPTYTFLSDSNLGMFRAATNTLGFTTAGTEKLRISGVGNVGIGTTSPTGVLHLKAGTAAASTAPLKLTSGVNLTTPEAGAIEFDGTNLYYTNSANARQTISTGASSVTIGQTTGTAMGADAVPNCTSVQKLQMSAGPTFAWTCVADGSQWTTTGSDVYYNSGKVGIGTTAPTTKLHVVGDTFIDGGLTLNYNAYLANTLTNDTNPLVTVGSGAYGFGRTATGSHFALFSANDFRFRVNGSSTDLMTIKAGGNVGIGTTEPRGLFDISPTATATDGSGVYLTSQASTVAFKKAGDIRLETPASYYAGNIYLTSRSGYTHIGPVTSSVGTVTQSGTAVTGVGTAFAAGMVGSTISVAGGTPQTIAAVGSATTLTTATGATAGSGSLYEIRSSAGLVVANGGNVGIGTTAPAANLQVRGDLNTSAENWIVNLQNNNNETNTPTAGLLFNVGDAISAKSGIIFKRTAGNGRGDLHFLNNNASDATTPTITAHSRMTITSAGNIGIGTTSPSSNAALHVNSGSTGWGLALTQPTLGGGSSHSILLGRNLSANETATISYTYGGTAATRYLGFGTWNTPKQMIIDESGNVGIGTTSPGMKLDVSGDIRIATASKLYIGAVAVCDSTGCPSPSDIRYKENIAPLNNSLENILKIQGVGYDWIDKQSFNDKHQIGFIAQDLEKIYPEVVKTDEKTGFKSVMYDHLVAPLIEAFKTLYGRVQGLEASQETQGRMIASKADKAEVEIMLTTKDQEITQLKQENEAQAKQLDAMKAYLCAKDKKAAFCQ